MILNFLRKSFQQIILTYWQIRGVYIKRHATLTLSTYFSRGFLNGKKGTIEIGERCDLAKGTVIKAYGGDVKISVNTFLGEYVCIYGHGGIEIGENTLIAMHTCILSSNHTIPSKAISIRSQGDVLLPVKIGDDVWIGAGCKILGGVTIGNGCVIGAGSVVTKNLPPYSIAVGIPARVIKHRND